MLLRRRRPSRHNSTLTQGDELNLALTQTMNAEAKVRTTEAGAGLALRLLVAAAWRADEVNGSLAAGLMVGGGVQGGEPSSSQAVEEVAAVKKKLSEPEKVGMQFAG